MNFEIGDLVLMKGTQSPIMAVMSIDTDNHQVTASWRPDGNARGLAEESFTLQQLTLLEPIIQYFRFAHLPIHLQEHSRPFGELAKRMLLLCPRNPERTVALRKLLEAKDAAVRASITQ